MRKASIKIAQMASMDLPAELAVAVEANAVEQITRALRQSGAALLIREVVGCAQQNWTVMCWNWRNSRVCGFAINISYRIYPVRMTVG